MSSKAYALVEGHGEVAAATNLLTRLWHEQGRHEPWAPALRWKNLHQERGIASGVERIRMERDAGALLILRDEDDACPKERGPEIARWVAKLTPPCPVAVVLLHPEYEVLFLPCMVQMAGRPLVGPDGQQRPGLVPGTRYEGDWEAKRDVKGWLTQHFPPGRSYKPVVDQLALTRLIEFAVLRDAKVPSFGTLERALTFLGEHFGGAGVYPDGGDQRA